MSDEQKLTQREITGYQCLLGAAGGGVILSVLSLLDGDPMWWVFILLANCWAVAYARDVLENGRGRI